MTLLLLLKEKFGKREVIIDALYSQLQHLPMATNQISDVKSTFENIEKILRQLESQRKILITIRYLFSRYCLSIQHRLSINLKNQRD